MKGKVATEVKEDAHVSACIAIQSTSLSEVYQAINRGRVEPISSIKWACGVYPGNSETYAFVLTLNWKITESTQDTLVAGISFWGVRTPVPVVWFSAKDL